MKRLFITMISIVFLLVSAMVYAQSDQLPAGTPPVAQALVPEGDFALKLVTALKLGTPGGEAEAEDMLTSVGIEPKNGWIADYPVTPDIIGELQTAVGAAADSRKLPVGKDEALKAFQSVSAGFGLPVVADTSGDYAEDQPPTSPPYTEPAVVNNYYYEEGPPVVSYYPPPWDYYYMYAWVPYPFWFNGFFFSGFFCLHDFHRVVIVGHHRFVVTNHFFDRRAKRVSTIDPARRRTGEPFRTADISRNRGFSSNESRRGASSIFERSRERPATLTAGKGSSGNNFVSPKTGGRTEEQRFTNKENNSQPFNTRRGGSVRQPSNVERRNEMNLRRPAGGEGISFKAPSVSNERSFSAPSMGDRGGSRSFGSSESSGRSFSAPNRGSERSFGSPSMGNRGSFGGSRGGFSGGGGFARGGSSGGGGCRGRC
jgi:hypothetical protein